MKFIVSSSLLLKELNSIAGVINASNTLPILENFLFHIKKKDLNVSASDLESTMSTTISLDKSDKDGIIAIPSKLLLDTLKTFPEQPLTFVINDENFGIELITDNGKYKLAGQNGEEFPKSPKLESPAKVVLDSNVLSSAVNKTLFATGNDELRPVMSGIFFEINKDNVTFVATDAITSAEHAGRVLLLGEVGGNADVVLTLPDATGTGHVYKFIVTVTMGSNTYKIQCPDADNVINGTIKNMDLDGTAQTIFGTASTSDTITLNGGTQGGQVSDTLTLIDIAANLWHVEGQMRTPTGANPATPFSAAVS